MNVQIEMADAEAFAFRYSSRCTRFQEDEVCGATVKSAAILRFYGHLLQYWLRERPQVLGRCFASAMAQIDTSDHFCSAQ